MFREDGKARSRVNERIFLRHQRLNDFFSRMVPPSRECTDNPFVNFRFFDERGNRSRDEKRTVDGLDIKDEEEEKEEGKEKLDDSSVITRGYDLFVGHPLAAAPSLITSDSDDTSWVPGKPFKKIKWFDSSADSSKVSGQPIFATTENAGGDDAFTVLHCSSVANASLSAYDRLDDILKDTPASVIASDNTSRNRANVFFKGEDKSVDSLSPRPNEKISDVVYLTTSSDTEIPCGQRVKATPEKGNGEENSSPDVEGFSGVSTDVVCLEFISHPSLPRDVNTPSVIDDVGELKRNDFSVSDFSSAVSSQSAIPSLASSPKIIQPSSVSKSASETPSVSDRKTWGSQSTSESPIPCAQRTAQRSSPSPPSDFNAASYLEKIRYRI